MKKKLYTILFPLIFMFSFLSGYSQIQHFEKVLTQEGEANLSVRQIIQDKQGFLWLATFSGLYRFNGNDFIYQHQFRNNTQINPDITALLQDKHNNIWIGTNDGLSKYNPETEELTTYKNHPSQPNSIGSNKIRSLAMDKNHRIWIGTFDEGLFLYEPTNDEFKHINFKNFTDSPPSYIRTIFPDDDNKMWFGTLNNGLYCFRYTNSTVDSLVNYREQNEDRKLSHNYVYEIFKDTDGTMVIGTHGGLNVFNRELNRFEDLSSTQFQGGSMTNYFRSVYRTRNGKLWIGTWGGLIICDSFSDIKSGNYQLVLPDRNSSSSISHNQIMNVFQDISGIIWVATENGLNRYDPYFNQFKPLHGQVIDELSEQTATDFYPYKNSVLILSLSDGIIEKQGNQLKTFFRKDTPEFKPEKFYSLFVDSEDNIWGGSYSGMLVKLDAKTKTTSTFKHSDENIPIYSIAEMENNILTIGTYGEGLKYFNTHTERFEPDRGLSATIEINDVFIDTKKRLWVATELGIFKKDNAAASFEYFLPDAADSILSPNIFIEIAESRQGEIYVGGRNGLYIYNENLNSFFNKKFENPARLWVTNLQFDSEQNLWMNLNFNKIAKWDKQQNQLLTFNVNSGIRSSSYNRRGFFIDKYDHILLSGFDQIYEFNAANPVTNNFSPTPVFTSLLINNTEIHPNIILNDQKILNKTISYEKEIELNHRNKDFTISFSSASYINTKDNKYRYRLTGSDHDWKVGNERSAYYTNLRPGKYTFEVFGANNDGVWSENPASLNIQIKPALLLSFWAFVVYFIILLIIIYFARRLIIVRIALRQELLVEKVKRDKEEKFNQERLRFYTNISHELRTPLTLIMGPTKDLISSDKTSPERARLHQLILNNSQRLLSLVNQLLDFRKSLHRGMTLKVVHSNLVEIIESNIEAFSYMAEEKNIRVDFKTTELKLQGWFDLEKLDIILFNILSNAFKYTPEYGFIELELKTATQNKKLQTEHIELKISNTGKGIPKDLQGKVFERFYQVVDETNTTNINTGTGIGLELIKNIVELHHGKITLESIPGKSTTFTIFLPINKEDYSEQEIFDFTRDADRRTKEMIKSVDTQNEESVYEKKDPNQKKLLIVEDNQELRDYLSRFLSRDYRVYTATNGQEGLQQSKEKNPDLIISDVMMDNIDGLQFCKELKSTPEISHIPIILMTALASIENKLQGYKTGADDYITKPFEPELLKIRVKNILQNRSKTKLEFAKNPDVASKELTVSKIDEEFLNKAIDLLTKNLDNGNFDIDSFSKNLGVSSSQLYRKIKGISGVSPNEFIRTFRLRQAAKMITNTNLSMSEIAYKVGFNDSLYFSKCFKKQFGEAPSKYSKGLETPDADSLK